MGEVKQWPIIPRPIPPGARHANDLPYTAEEADRIYHQRMVEAKQRAYEAQRRADASASSLYRLVAFGLAGLLLIGLFHFLG